MIRIFNSCSTFAYFTRIQEKTLSITGSQGENKLGDPIFLLQFINVLCMTFNYAKFEKNLDSTSVSKELACDIRCIETNITT